MEDYHEITNNLLIGGAFLPLTNPKLLKSNKITHIVDLTYDKEFKSKLKQNEENFTYLKCEIEDSEESVEKFKKNLDALHKFIESGIKAGKVLVHCNCGVSRSATLILSYLMKYEKLSLINAFIKLKTMRTIVQPNTHFIKFLMEYEHTLYKQTTMTEDTYRLLLESF